VSEREQVGWIDEFGNCFPLNAWQTTYHDDGKGRWKPLYTAPQSAAALRSQVAALREALDEATEFLRDYDVQRQAQRRYQSLVTDTEAAAKEYERELRNRVLEEAARAADIDVGNLPREEWSESTELVKATVAIIRAMKETP